MKNIHSQLPGVRYGHQALSERSDEVQADVRAREQLVEQSKASNDIAVHIEKIAQMTEHNSVAAEATTQEADNLVQMADTMRIALEKFHF